MPHFSFILHTFLSNAILVKRKNDSRCRRRNFFPSEVKRETGANPVRSRHCKREMKDTIVTGLTSGKTYFRDDPQARKPACCRYRRLPLRATRTWPYHSDTHAHTDQPVVRYRIREFFLLCLFVVLNRYRQPPGGHRFTGKPQSGLQMSAIQTGIHGPLSFRAARIRLFLYRS